MQNQRKLKIESFKNYIVVRILTSKLLILLWVESSIKWRLSNEFWSCLWISNDWCLSKIFHSHSYSQELKLLQCTPLYRNKPFKQKISFKFAKKLALFSPTKIKKFSPCIFQQIKFHSKAFKGYFQKSNIRT